MTFSLEFDEARNLISVSATRSGDRAVRLEALAAARMDPRFRHDYDILCRFSDNHGAPGQSECLHLGLTLSAFFRGQKIALVVSKDELRNLQESVAIFNSTERVEISVMRTVTAATNWLTSQRNAIAA